MRIRQSIYLLHPKFPEMIKFNKQLATTRYSKEASELNKLVIKLKKEILKGTVTTISMDVEVSLVSLDAMKAGFLPADAVLV